MKPGEVVLQRYQIRKLLGQGSMGVTYKAFDLQDRRLVAIKQLHLSRMQEWKSLEMFEREARILQQLSHPRVPGYIDYFPLETDEGLQFLLVQQYVEGKTLKELIDEGWHGSETDILDIFLDLVDILVTLHSVCPPVIHRDINPKNIVISPNTQVSPVIHDVYLVDFGAVQDKIRTTVLGGTTAVGTFGYVPFEQFSGQAVPASDYYALGATLLYMLTHRHPSEFPAEDLKPQFAPFLYASPAVSQLLDGLLEPSVKTRIASPEQIHDILHELPLGASGYSSILTKPPDTVVEKIMEKPAQLTFRIPTQKIGVVLKRKVLTLNPKWMTLREELLGLRSGKLWQIPTKELQASDVTWYFAKGKRKKRGQTVLGLNYGGETFEIAAQLSKTEIDWLSGEISDYLWEIRHEAQRFDREADAFQTSSAFAAEEDPPPSSPPPDETRIKRFVKKPDQLRFRIPKVMTRSTLADFMTLFLVCIACASASSAAALYLTLNTQPGLFLGGLAAIVAGIFWILGLGIFLSGFSRIFGRTTIYLSPEWVRVSSTCLGVGYSQHIQTAALHPTDLIRYFHKNTMLLGINYDGKTIKFGAGLTRQEIDWLIHEINAYIRAHAKPIPQNLLMADLEMK